MKHASEYQNTWQSILWRLILTALLLFILAVSSITIFDIPPHSNPYAFMPASQQLDTATSR